MPSRETTVARLGLVALAIALWKHASLLIFDGQLPRRPEAVWLLVITYVVSFAALLVAASSSARAVKYARYSIGAFVLVSVVVAFRDSIEKASSEFLPTNDGHLFMDVAARDLLAGRNPYLEPLAEAFRIYRMPLSYSTPLLDGDFSDRQAYPALSFLTLVPAILLHVPTYLVYGAAFIAAVAIAIQKAPWWARPIVAAAFTLEQTYYSFAFGGVTDTVWVLFLVGAIVWWRTRPVAAAVLIGLACAYKQHPWFLVPLLLVRLGHEHGERPWGPAGRRFVAIVAGVFVLINAPFMVWNARAWYQGITEPLVAPMIQLSEGLTAFSMTGWIAMPRAGTSVIFWSVYALALFAYVRHTRMLRDWCWVVPGVVLWFGYRALMSYWYFFALTAVVAMFTAKGDAESEEDGDADAPPAGPSWRPTGIAAGVLGAGIVAFMVWSAGRPPPMRVALVSTIEAWDLRGFSMRVRVDNMIARTVKPQFWMQSTGIQPMPWVIDKGPIELKPGESEEYVIRAPKSFREFDVTERARLEVHDRIDPGQRTFMSLNGDRTLKRPDAVPNPDFRVVETRTHVPSGWAFESTDAKLAVPNLLRNEARLAFEFAAQTVRERQSSFAACVVAQHLGDLSTGSRSAVLSTVLPLPDSGLKLSVNVPASANKPPFDTLYGVVLAVPSFRVVVLFGDEIAHGTLPTGEAFMSLPVKRGAWTTVEIAPRAILEQHRAPLRVVRHKYLRFPTLDFPSVPLEIGLLATAPKGVSATVEFGRIEQLGSTRPYEQLAQRSSPAEHAAWRAEIDLENANYAKAIQRLQFANEKEPTTERLIRLGDAYLFEKDYARARDAFAKASAGGEVPEAEQGLGFALIDLKDYAGAREHLERSRAIYEKVEKSSPRFRYMNALIGLMRISAFESNCDAAKRYRDEIVAEAPALPPPSIFPCP